MQDKSEMSENNKHDITDMNENSLEETHNEVVNEDMQSTSKNGNNDLPTTSRNRKRLIENRPQRLLFTSPFFEVVHQSADNTKFILRCCTCGAQKRASINGTSVAKNHLKRFHPDICTIYERNKRKPYRCKKDDEYKKLSAYSSGYSKFPDNSENYIISEYKREIQDAIANNIQVKNCSKEAQQDLGDEDTSTSSNNVDCNLLSTPAENIRLSNKTSVFNTVKEKLIYSPPFFQIIHLNEQAKKFNARCYICGQQFSCVLCSSTTHLKSHLERGHPVVFKLYNKCKQLNVYPSAEYDLSSTPEEILSLIEKSEERPNSRPYRNLVLLFAPPFFEITSKTVVDSMLNVRCCTCGELNSALPSNIHKLRKHLESHHPHLLHIYDKYKNLLNYFCKFEIPENYKQYRQESSTRKPKRLKKNQPQRLIFTSPFFKILHQSADNTKYILSCCTCGAQKRVTLNNTTCAKDHLKRDHPDIFIRYESNKWVHFSKNKSRKEEKELNKLDKLMGTNLIEHELVDYEEEISKTYHQNKHYKINSELMDKEVATLSKNVKCESPPTSEEFIKKEKNNISFLSSKTNPIKSRDNERIFTSQFFKLVHTHANGKKIVRCYTCGKLMRAYSTYSKTRLTQHVQRHHPDLYKLYKNNRCIRVSSSSVTNVHTYEFDNNPLGTKSFQKDKNEAIEDSQEAKDQLYKIISPKNTNESNLSDSNLKNIEVIIDQSLKNLVKQTGYFELKNKITKILAENDSIMKLKSDLENVKKQCSQLRLEVRQSKASKKQLQIELQKLDNLLHERKLIIKNIKISNKQQPLKDVENLLKFKLNLSKIKVINCAIITKQRTSRKSNTETVLIELLNAEDCNLVLSQIYKLNNTSIIIEPELSSEHRKRRSKLLVLRKELLDRKPDLKVFVHRLTLVVNGKNFYWDDTEGLCHDCSSTMSTDISGVEYLNNLTGLDVREIINILQKYEIKAF